MNSRVIPLAIACALTIAFFTAATPAAAQGPIEYGAAALTFLPVCICSSVFSVCILAFAAFLIRGALIWQQFQKQVQSATLVTIGSLQPKSGIVRLVGTISNVPAPLNPEGGTPLAVLRLHIEGRDRFENGWRTAADKTRTTPFVLADDTGSIRVLPDRLMKHVIGDGTIKDEKGFQTALPTLAQILGIRPMLIALPGLRYQMWTLNAGQRVTVIGTVRQHEGNLEIAKAGSAPLVVSDAESKTLEQEPVREQKGLLILGVILGVIGLSCPCCMVVGLIQSGLGILGGK